MTSPSEEGRENYCQIEEALNRFKEEHPDFDLRWFSNFYYGKPPIGSIRKTLWNTALALTIHEGTLDDGDVIGCNHDIDTERLTPNYIQRIYDYYISMSDEQLSNPKDRLPIAYSMTRHTSNIPDMPNLSEAISWWEYLIQQHRIAGINGFEASMIIPFSKYALHNGHDEGAETYETERFREFGVRVIPQSHYYTSPRRFVTRLTDGSSLRNIWEDGTFTNTDECRDPNLQRTDLTFEELELIILDTLNEDIGRYILEGPLFDSVETYTKGLKIKNDADDLEDKVAEVKKYAIELAQIKIALVARYLREVVRSSSLADMILNDYNIESEIDSKFSSRIKGWLMDRFIMEHDEEQPGPADTITPANITSDNSEQKPELVL